MKPPLYGCFAKPLLYGLHEYHHVSRKKDQNVHFCVCFCLWSVYECHKILSICDSPKAPREVHLVERIGKTLKHRGILHKSPVMGFCKASSICGAIQQPFQSVFQYSPFQEAVLCDPRHLCFGRVAYNHTKPSFSSVARNTMQDPFVTVGQSPLRVYRTFNFSYVSWDVVLTELTLR